VIGVWFIFVLMWLAVWVVALLDYRRGYELFESSMRFVWIVTIGFTFGTAVMLAVII
jgi:hypothetical protein